MRAAAILVSAWALTACGGDGPTVQAPPPRDVTLTREPYLGVRCSVPSSIACDRVGLALWLSRRAREVRAQVAGHPVVLRLVAADDPRGVFYEGVLRRDGLLRRGALAVESERGRWAGDPPLDARVVVTAEGMEREVLSVPLRAGYG